MALPPPRRYASSPRRSLKTMVIAHPAQVVWRLAVSFAHLTVLLSYQDANVMI